MIQKNIQKCYITANTTYLSRLLVDHDNCDCRVHYGDRIGLPDCTDGMIMLYAVRPNYMCNASRYALSCLWNQLSPSLRQPHFTADSFSFYFRHFICLCSISFIIHNSLSFTPSLKPTFSQIIPGIDSFSVSLGLTPRLLVFFRYSEIFCF